MRKTKGGDVLKSRLYNLKNSPFVIKPFGGINANILRFIAVTCMLLDHTRSSLIDGNVWMNCIGRLAFPIFAFQIAEGFIHTRNLKKYVLRLLAFAVISEIPFNIIISSETFYPGYQNVLFTFVLSVAALKILEKAKKEPTLRNFVWAGSGVAVIVYLAEVLRVDYGGAGVVVVVAFYLLRDFPFAFFAQFAALFTVFVIFYPGCPVFFRFDELFFKIPIQAFALFSLVPIWLYNGKKGRGGKVLQYSFYGFYPAHMAILCVIRYLLMNII